MTAPRPLRIAFFVTNFPKLSEIFVLNQALALMDRGHVVDVYALSDPREAAVQPGTELIPANRVHVAGMPAGMLARFATLPRLLARNGTADSLAALDPLRGGSEAVTLRHFYRLDALRKVALDYDVVHAQNGSVARQCAFLRRRGRFGVPFVASLRGSDLSRYLAFGLPGAYDDVFAEAAFCLPVARRWIASLVELGCPVERIRHLPSGIPVDRIGRRDLSGWGGGEFPTIVSACRIERYKGIGFGLDAFHRLLDRCPAARYDVYGDGPERPALMARAERLGIASRVRWHGAVSHGTILDALTRADIHWFTTTTGRDGRTEGVPNILKEAQAAGLPAVAFEHPGVDEVVTDGETGLIVPEGDAAALAEATLRLVADGNRAQAMGALAATRARATYDLDRLTLRLEAIYAEAIAGTSEPRA